MMAAYRPYYGEYPFIGEKYGNLQLQLQRRPGSTRPNTGRGDVLRESVYLPRAGPPVVGGTTSPARPGPDIWLNEGFATYTECVWGRAQARLDRVGPAYLAAIHRAQAHVRLRHRVPHGTSRARATIFSSNVRLSEGARGLLAPAPAHRRRHHVLTNILGAYRARVPGIGRDHRRFQETVASAVYGAGSDLVFSPSCVYGPGAARVRVGLADREYQRPELPATAHPPRARTRRRTPTTCSPCPSTCASTPPSGNQDVHGLEQRARRSGMSSRSPRPATGVVVDENSWILTTANVIEAYVNGPAQGCAGPRRSRARFYAGRRAVAAHGHVSARGVATGAGELRAHRSVGHGRARIGLQPRELHRDTGCGGAAGARRVQACA